MTTRAGMGIRFAFYSLLAVLGISLMAYVKTTGITLPYAVTAFLSGGLVLAGLVFLNFDPLGFLCVILMFMAYHEGVLRFEMGVATLSVFNIGVIAATARGLAGLAMGTARYSLHIFDLFLALLCALFLATTMTSGNIIESGYLAFHALFIPTVSYLAIRMTAAAQGDEHMLMRAFMAGLTSFITASLVHLAISPGRLTFLEVDAVSIATISLVPLFHCAFGVARRNPAHIVAIALCLVAIFFTFSRVYLLAVLLSPILLRLIKKGWSAHIYAVFVVGTLVLTVILAMGVPDKTVEAIIENDFQVDFDKDYIEKAGSYERLYSPSQWMKSMEFRLLAYRLGLENFLRHPVAGVGMIRGRTMVTQHNFHIEWLEYGGLLGYFLYFNTLLFFFVTFGPRARTDPTQAVYNLVALTIVINSLTNGFMHGFFPYVTFVIFGLSFARRPLPRRAAAARSGHAQ